MTLAIFFYSSNDTNVTSLYPSSVSSLSDQTVDTVANNDYLLLLTRYIVQKLCVPLVVLIGVIGNSLSVVVLTRNCMKSSTNTYLTALAVFDLLYLLFSFYLSLQHHLMFKYLPTYIYCYRFARVFTDMFANVSVILTVTFTLERYIGVCHPIRGRILCTVQRAKIITMAVAAVAMLCTTPEFWEMEVIWLTVDNQTVPVVKYTDFAERPSYAVGYYWFLTVMFTLFPLSLLCVFNVILIVTVIKAAELRKQMTLLTPVSSTRFLNVCGSLKSTHTRVVHCQPREQQKITLILIIIVLVFIICQIPGAALLLIKTTLGEAQLSREQKNNFRIAGNVTNLLIQINAAMNFTLYSAISTKFRRVFCHIVCNRKRWCRRQYHLRHHHHHHHHQSTTGCRSDALQMSSFYGDKPLSKLASHPNSYSCQANSPNRSSPGISDGSPTSHQQDLASAIVRSDTSTSIDNRKNQYLGLNRTYNCHTLIKSRRYNSGLPHRTWDKMSERDSGYFVNNIMCSRSDESVLGST